MLYEVCQNNTLFHFLELVRIPDRKRKWKWPFYYFQKRHFRGPKSRTGIYWTSRPPIGLVALNLDYQGYQSSRPTTKEKASICVIFVFYFVFVFVNYFLAPSRPSPVFCDEKWLPLYQSERGEPAIQMEISLP